MRNDLKIGDVIKFKVDNIELSGIVVMNSFLEVEIKGSFTNCTFYYPVSEIKNCEVVNNYKHKHKNK